MTGKCKIINETLVSTVITNNSIYKINNATKINELLIVVGIKSGIDIYEIL